MIIPVSPLVRKVSNKLELPQRDYAREIEQKTYEGVIWSCEHIDKCSEPHYVGKCKDECFKRLLGGGSCDSGADKGNCQTDSRRDI